MYSKMLRRLLVINGSKGGSASPQTLSPVAYVKQVFASALLSTLSKTSGNSRATVGS
jgi:hypothetical protein